MIFATDFTAPSQLAGTAAAQLAQRARMALRVVHVVPELGAQLEETVVGLSRKALATEVERLSLLGAEVAPSLLRGNVRTRLQEVIREHRPRVVVLGAPSTEPPGSSGLSGWLPVHTEAPVMIVRGGEGFNAWVSGQRRLKVVLGVDRSATAAAARAWVQWLGTLGPLEVLATHVYWPGAEAWRLGVAPSGGSGGEARSRALEEALEREVRELVTPMGDGVEVRLVPAMGRLADHLVDFAAEQHADLLVVGTHQRRGLGKLASVSHHSLRLARSSLVTVPAIEEAATVVATPVRRILVAMDFSPNADCALARGLGMLQPGGTLRLVTVCDGEPTAQERQLQMRRLAARVPTGGLPEGASIDLEVLPGPGAARRLCQAAERFSADVICLGARGAPGPLRALLGSVSLGVMEGTERPVLLVRACHP